MCIFICDDEEKYLKELKSLIETFFNEKKIEPPTIELFSCGEDALTSETVPNIVFMDVEMQGMSGTQVGKKMKEQNPDIKIFIVTSHIGYLDEAFRFSFFRFLSKPINKVLLFRNLNDAIFQHTLECTDVDIEMPGFVKNIYVKDIICIKVEKRGCIIFTANGAISNSKNITYWENKLIASSFFRTHREYIVNLKFVAQFTKTTITLRNGECSYITAYLSERKHKSFKEKYFWFKERLG